MQWMNQIPFKLVINNESKGKVHPRTGHEGPEGKQRYNSTVSLTLALDGVGGQRHAPAALPPGKTRYPLYSRLGGSQSRSGHINNEDDSLFQNGGNWTRAFTY